MKLFFRFICVYFMALLPTILVAQNKLFIGVGTDISPAAQRRESAENIANFLAKKLQVPVEIIVTDKNTELIQLLQDKRIDLAFFNTFSYILAANEVEIEPLVVVSENQKDALFYQSCLINYPESPIQNIAELKNLKGKLDVLFVNPTSTSGHLIPRLYFNNIGLDYSETHFRNVNFAGNHLKTIQQISEKKAHLGACSCDDLQKAIKKGDINAQSINVIWKSDPIANGPVAIRKDFAPAQRQQIKEAFLVMGKEQPQLLADIQRLWHLSKEAQGFGFVAANDSLYESVRSMANSIEELILIINYYID